MKRIKFLFAAMLALVVLNGSVYGQDTTLTVTSAGNVGIGTTDPQQKLHVAGGFILANGLGNEQAYIGGDGAGADVQVGSFNSAVTNFAIWNEATKTRMNLFANDMFAFGNVGIGTTSPTAKLHLVNGSAGFTPSTATELAIESSGITRIEVMSPASGVGQILFGSPTEADRGFITYDHANDAMILGSGGGTKMIIDDNGNVSIGAGGTPSFPLVMASGAHVTAGGVWTDASSKQYKENIANLTQEEAISALEKLNPVKFNYKVQKDEEYLGFIAEDVPDLVATKARKGLSPMDIVAVLTKVVQQHQQKIAELEARLNAGQ